MSPETSPQIIAALLRQGRLLDRFSSTLAVCGLLLGLAQALLGSFSLTVALACPALFGLGLLQKYWAVRVALDSELFERLASHELALETLDNSLLAQGLLRPENAGRSMCERGRGALNLLRWQVALLALQALVGLAALLALLVAGR